jgi:hypothetical protein
VARSLGTALERFVMVWRRYGLGRIFGGSLGWAVAHGTRGPVFVAELLEPLLVATEDRLAAHVARGELREGLDLRAEAIRLVGPLLVALLHQDTLGGVACRPLDVDAFARDHVARFLDGIRAEGRR